MSVVSKDFTALGQVSATLSVPPQRSMSYAITGTFVATLVLEHSFNNGVSWTIDQTYTTTGQSSTALSLIGQGMTVYRFRCTAYTSGTATATMDPVSGIVKEFLSVGQVREFAVTDTGASAPTPQALVSPAISGTPTGAIAYDPGSYAQNTLRVASDVVSATTVTVGANVFEIEIVNTDSADNTADDSFNQDTGPITVAKASYTHLSTTLGTLIRVEDEIMRLTAYNGTDLTYSRAQSGTTIAAHADATDIYKGDGVVAGRIAVGLVTTLTPTGFTPAFVADFNEHGTTDITAEAISDNQIQFTADVIGANTTATTETLAGANNAFAAVAMYGGRAQAAKQFAIIQAVPTAMDVVFGTMLFALGFTPTTVQVLIVVTATPGIALAWDGAITIDGGNVTIDNTGTADWAVTNTVTLIAVA